MASAARSVMQNIEYRDLPTSPAGPLWYAAYTSANREKRVAEQLTVRTVEHFLPCYESVRRWKDRRVRLEMPLFPGYVFVRITSRDRLQVLGVPGVVRIVGFGGHLAALPECQIDLLRQGLLGGALAQPHPYLKRGCRVRIRNGALQGAVGILIRKKGRFRVVLSVDLIMRSIAVEVDAADIEPVLKTVPRCTVTNRPE